MKLRVFRSLLLAGVAIASLQSNVAEALLAGVKTTGMAATSVAYPVDCLVGAYNPAGISAIGSRWDSGISWIQTYQRINIHDLPDYSTTPGWSGLPTNPSTLNGSRDGAKTPNAWIPEGGIVKNWGSLFGCCDFEFSTGFLVYNRNDLKTTYGRPFELFGTSPTGLDFVHETASLVLSARWCQMHSIGIAINYNIQRLKVDGLQTFADDTFSIEPTHSTNRGYNYSNGVGVIIGYLFEWNCLKAGVAWQPQTTMRKFDKYDGFVADHGMFDLPQRYTAGISYRFFNCLAVAFDWEHIDWTDIPQLANPTFPNLDLGVTDPDYKLGAKNGAGFGWKDQNFFRVGVEYTINPCFTVRAGFRHAATPIQPEFTAVNILTLDCMENVVTFGGTWKVNACNELSFFWAQGITKEVKGKNSIPTTLPVVVGNSVVNYPINAVPVPFTNPFAPGQTQADGELDLKQRRYGMGIAWGRHF